MNKTKSVVALLTVALALPAGIVRGQAVKFEPGKLAVLRVGDGGPTGGASDFESRQNPVFVDQYDGSAVRQEHPSFSVAIPARGTNALWLNGNAGTEGGMERSADHRFLTVPGYCGDILSMPGTPSRLGYERGVCIVDADGGTRVAFKGPNWYGVPASKNNPRDAVSDGTNNFWGAGSAMGTLFHHNGAVVQQFKQVPSTRAVKIIGNTIYVSAMAADAGEGGKESSTCGIYALADLPHALSAHPNAAQVAAAPMILAVEPYTHTVGFDINPQGTVAYTADVAFGIQKYVKSGNGWKMAVSFYIPGYDGPDSGILTNAASTAVRTGCFGLAVDFSGPHPVLYATTTDALGYHGKCPNANRLIRIDDTNTLTSGVTVTNFGQTLATAGATNMSFRAVAFTPERRP